MQARLLPEYYRVMFVGVAFTMLVCSCTDNQEQDVTLTSGPVEELGEQSGLTAQVTQRWVPVGAGSTLTTAGGEAQWSNSDLACLKAHLDIENNSSSAKEISALFLLRYGSEAVNLSIFLDEDLQNKIQDEITVAAEGTKRIYFYPRCEDYGDLTESTPLLIHPGSETRWILSTPDEHDIFFQKKGCDHFLDGTIEDMKWEGVAGGTEVMNRGKKSVILGDVVGIDITLELTNNAEADLYFRPPLSLVNEDHREVTAVTGDTNQELPEFENGGVKLEPGQSKTIYLNSRMKGFNEMSGSDELYLYSLRHGWKLKLTPLPKYEELEWFRGQ